MRNPYHLLWLLLLCSQFSYAVTYTWNTYVAGNLTYTNGNMSTTITGTAFDTRGPQDPNGGANNGYRSPKFVSAATINTYQGGFTNDYGMPGLVLGHDWINLSSTTVVTITFANPVGGPVSFNIYDINTGSWGGNNPVWIDKVTIAGTNCAGTAVYPTISGCSNSVSGANSNIVTGNLNCTNQTNTVTFNSASLKTITITYASGSPLASGYGNDPDPQYIILSDITASAYNLLSITSQNPSIGCAGSTATLSASSSVGNATYAWAGPNSGNPAGTTPNAASTSVNAAGTYTVTVTDPGSGCTASSSVSVASTGSTVQASTTAGNAICGNNSGSASVTATGGNGSFTYSWSNSSTQSTLNNLSPGTYTVTVTSAGCTATASASVGSAGNVNASASATDAGCNNTGSASALATSGTGTYGYLWSNGATTASISGLGAGTYTVTVSSGTCTATASTVVNAAGAISIAPSATNATCGSSNGSAVVTVTAGTGPFSYLWSNGVTDASLTNLPAGSYTVTVTAPGNCTASGSATVNQTGSVTATINSTNASCNTGGSATVNAQGGTGNFSYLWSNGNTAATAGNLAGGTYNVTVTSGTCTATATVTVASSGGITLTPTVSNTSCGGNNGSLSVAAINGTAPYSYLWSNGSTAASLANLAAGSYSATVTDAANCSATISTTVAGSAVTPPSITASNNNICPGDSVQICCPAGYVSYLWNTGKNTPCMYTQFAGNYRVTVTDQNNCTAVSNQLPVSVYQMPPVSVSVNGDTLTAYNAVAYQWLLNGNPIPGATNSVYIATEPGDYQVIVTDVNGCRAVSNRVSLFQTGISAMSVEDVLRVYPNPLAGGRWNVEVNENCMGGLIQLTDVAGKIIYSSTVHAALLHVDVEVASGIYFLRVFSNKNSITKKLWKQ